MQKKLTPTRPSRPNKPLAAYKQKRDFKITSEPPPKKAKSDKQPIFVIQQHHATRLHWDFRLEADGVLKSWAVTKEPTLDPSVKRLAVHVEDHPLAYAKFHGQIPQGQYGAGQVDIWDNGTYEPKGNVSAGERSGKIEVNLHGKKLNGMFALVRMGAPSQKENWLLIKMKDDYAQPGTAPADKPSKLKGRAASAAAVPHPTPRRKTSKPPAQNQVQFTHPEKLMFPDANLTKADLIRFYIEIADHLIPHLKNRPCTLERLPDGLTSANAPRFWQKNTPDYYPAWIPRAKLKAENGKSVEYVLVNDEHVLAYLVNQACITFHPYLSRVDNLNHPDYVLFDLDPDDADFSDAVKIAKNIHAVLQEQDIEAFVKTSGKSGLHILAPTQNKTDDYEKARDWAMQVAQEVTAQLPKIATTQRSKDSRKGRVYVDVMQNAQGKHVVPPYVVRITPLATVSTPLDWDELTSKLDPKKFTIDAVLKRVKRIDPMLPLLSIIGE